MKYVFGVNRFDRGVITSETSGDLPVGSAKYLLDVDPDMPYGALKGVLQSSTLSASGDWESFSIVQDRDSTYNMLKIDTSGNIVWYNDYYTDAFTSPATITGTTTGYAGGEIDQYLNGFTIGLGKDADPVWVGKPNGQFGADAETDVFQEKAYLESPFGFGPIAKFFEFGSYVYGVSIGAKYLLKFQYNATTKALDYVERTDSIYENIISACVSDAGVVYLLTISGTRYSVFALDGSLEVDTGARISYTMPADSSMSDIFVTENKVWISLYRAPSYNENVSASIFDYLTFCFDGNEGPIMNFDISDLSASFDYVEAVNRTNEFYNQYSATDPGYLYSAYSIDILIPRHPFIKINDPDNVHVGVLVEINNTDARLYYDLSSGYVAVKNCVMIIGEEFEPVDGMLDATVFTSTFGDSAGTDCDLVNLDDTDSFRFGDTIGAYMDPNAEDRFFMFSKYERNKVKALCIPIISTDDGIMYSEGSFAVEDSVVYTDPVGPSGDLAPYVKYVSADTKYRITIAEGISSCAILTTYCDISAGTSLDTDNPSLYYMPGISLAVGIGAGYYRKSETTSSTTAGNIHDTGINFFEITKIGDIVELPATKKRYSVVTEILSESQLDTDEAFSIASGAEYRLYRSNGNFSQNESYFWAASAVYDGFQEGPLSTFVRDYQPFGPHALGRSVTAFVGINGTLNKRITSIKIYRAKGTEVSDVVPETSFQYVGEIDLTDPVPTSDIDASIGSMYLQDNGTTGGSYEAATGVVENIDHMEVRYTVSALVNSMMLYGGCYVSDLDDGHRYIFRSQPGRYNQIDWTNNYALLKEEPVALVQSGNRCIAIDRSRSYIVEPVNMVIEGIIEGIGAESKRSVCESPFGAIVASHDRIYLVVNGQFNEISMAIVNTYQERDRTYPPVCYYDQKKNGYGICIVQEDATRLTMFFGLNTKSWWFMSDTGEYFTSGRSNEVLYVDSDGDMKEMHGSSSYKAYTWESPKMYPGEQSRHKKFYNVKIGCDNTGSVGTFTVTSDFETQTYTSAISGETIDLEFKSSWSPFIQFKVEDHPGDSQIDYIEFLFRAKQVVS